MAFTIELFRFIMMINSYEPELVNIIKYYMNTYTFKTKEELQEAVNLWCENMADALEKYGHISDWDVSLITDMSELFRNKTHFNDYIGGWDVSNVTDMSFMFASAAFFNQDLTQWCVTNFSSMPNTFSYSTSALTASNHPVWGTCP